MPLSDYNVSRLFLYRAVQEARTNIDEPGVSAKYTDAMLLDKIQQAYTMVLGELRRNAQSPVVIPFPVTLEAGKHEYPLPYHIAGVHSVFEEDNFKGRLFWHSRSRYSPYGPGVRIEGTTLIVPNPDELAGTELTVECLPGGAATFHIGTFSSTAVSEDRKTITLPQQHTLLLGALDTRRHAYIGSLIRVVGSDGYSGMEEHLIVAYNRDTRQATLQTPIDNAPLGGPNNALYEIAPLIYIGLDHVVGLYVARWIAGIEGHTSRARELARMYADGMRVVRLNAFYSRVDESLKVRGDTHDRRRYMTRG